MRADFGRVHITERVGVCSMCGLELARRRTRTAWAYKQVGETAIRIICCDKCGHRLNRFTRQRMRVLYPELRLFLETHAEWTDILMPLLRPSVQQQIFGTAQSI